jgi:hypothetical protein
MDEQLKGMLARMEGRARRATGLSLGLSGFACAYATALLRGQANEPAVLVFPALAGVCLYLAGELLGLIWFRVVTMQLLILQARRDKPAAAEARESSTHAIENGGNGVHLDGHEPLQEIEVVQAG